jgi:EAL domain-containing protein (putative c-di-GMP-specific phosphodiesterase class I)
MSRDNLRTAVLSSSVQGADLVGSLSGVPDLTPARMREGFSPAEIQQTDEAMIQAKAEGALSGLLIVGTTGQVVYAGDHALIGSSARSESDLMRALQGVDHSDVTGSGDTLDTLHGAALDAYVPLSEGGRVFGAVELSQPLGPLTSQVNSSSLGYYLTIGGGGVLVWLLLLPLVTRGVRLAVESSDPGRRQRLRELRRAIDQHELELHYQPIIEAASGDIRGVEALVRWRRGTELVQPVDFLPLAENSRLIGPLTAFVLDEAAAQAAAWERAGRELAVSVNLSAASLLDPALPRQIEAVLTRHALPSRLLHIEITETAVIEDEVQATASLNEISKLGVLISLDDFGTGYSSMTRVGSLPIKEKKIDRSFISNLTPERWLLAHGMLELGHTLGLRVVAEGVEDQATVTTLSEAGCDLLQGFFFSRPVPPDDLDRWRDARALVESIPPLVPS